MPNPIMPQILGTLDFITEPLYPGNWYNSQQQRFNSPYEAFYLDRIGQQADRFGQSLRSGAGRAGNWLGRLGSGIGDLAEGGAGFLSSLLGRGEPNWQDPNAGRWGPQELARADARRRSPTHRGPAIGRQNPGLDARRERLGMGQLGRAGDESMLRHMNAIRNRGGALMER